ncbi:hypothetical protein H6G61_19365 [Leptolyngbya sp. FACHB-238]|uniref:hypothetical protein n=1 Tax=Leptolyngbya sp. FACHB-238 TaxID=2692804 RepID=UPI0016832D9F|nr:hypothetical protein [Leptolyngbya sp. FACHB-238]MBD2375415.1 hypothetical protein [Leptolyngbya sp. FACHB-238]
MARKLPTQWLRAFQKPKADIEHPPAPIENYQHQPYSDHSPVLLEDDLDAEALPEPETEKSSRPVQHRVAKLGHRAASTASSATQVTARRLGKFAKAWRWQLIWLGIFGVFGGTGAIALHWLSSAPPAVDCQQVTAQSLEAEQLYLRSASRSDWKCGSDSCVDQFGQGLDDRTSFVWAISTAAARLVECGVDFGSRSRCSARHQRGCESC